MMHALAIVAAFAWVTQALADEAVDRRVDWEADFGALQQGLAHNYANFEYTITDRRIDLPALAQRYRQHLHDARSDDERRRAFERLLRDLRDPHVFVEWPSASGANDAAGASPACSPGLAARVADGGMAFDRLPEFTLLPDADARLFRAGVLRPRGRAPIGVIRIGLFIERAFAPVCQAAAAQLGMIAQSPCDEACGAKLDRLSARKLDTALVATLAAIERAGAKRLVIDVTDNGGGSDWSEIVARILAGPLRSARVAMLRHPAWDRYLADKLADIAQSWPSASARDRARLDRAARTIAAAREAVNQPCDLSAAWTDRDLALGRRPLPCTTLVRARFFATGPDASPAASPSDVEPLLFGPASYGALPARATRLQLVVLVNDETHSAAEQFAALLRDNRKAIVAGSVSAGAGCGTFTERGTSFVLPSSGARVHVPDCVRLRADGSNERRGIVPDRPVPWGPTDSAYQRAAKAARVLYAD